MSVDSEKLLQDYLDDRMTGEQRAEFEARLEGDDSLARRLAAALETRESLRSDAPELSPGFYTRTRARFEEQAQGRERRWFRPLSWETAGLAVAAALALVLIGPAVLRQDLEMPESVIARRAPLPVQAEQAPEDKRDNADLRFTEEEGTTKDAGGGASPRSGDSKGATQDELSALGYAAADNDAGEAETEEFDDGVNRLESRAASGAREKNAPASSDPSKEVSKPSEQAQSPSVAAASPPLDSPAPPAEDAANERQRAVTEYRAPALKQEPAKPRPKARTAPLALRETDAVEKLQKKAEETVVLDEERLDREAESARGQAGFASADLVAGRQTWVGLGGAALPAGVVAAGEFKVVESRAAWDALIAGPAGGAIGSLGARYGERRVVLIGSREGGLDCSQISTRGGADGYLVDLPELPDGDGAARDAGTSGDGCAILVPWDGARVFLVVAEP